jgi:hypothetical protein
VESIKNNRQKRHCRFSNLFDRFGSMRENHVYNRKHLNTTAMIYKITFKDNAGYYTVTKNFNDTDELGKYIQNEMQNCGGKEIGTEEFESIEEMLNKRYADKN